MLNSRLTSEAKVGASVPARERRGVVIVIRCVVAFSKKRSMILSALSILTFFLWSSVAFAQTLSLTFDDGLNPATEPNAQLWNKQIVSPKSAFDDPLYASEPDILPAGESIVWVKAKERGIQNLRYPGEDSVYEEPKPVRWVFCHSGWSNDSSS